MSGSVVGVIEGQLNALLMMQATSDIPQNVNFAIQTPIVINFLSVKGVSPTLADKGHKILDPAEVADLARAFTLQVACRSPEPSPRSVQSGSTTLPATPADAEKPRSLQPDGSSLLASSLGRWAVVLRLDGGAIIWQDGVGNIDIESVISTDENEFRTRTVNSIHKSGRSHPLGTNWIYSRNGFDAIQVMENGQRTFYISRCR